MIIFPPLIPDSRPLLYRLAPKAVGLLLQGRAIVHRKAVDLGRGCDPSLALLLHMGQLVPQQPLAGRVIGAELAGRKMDVCPLGIGQCPHRWGGGRFGVDPDARKIGVKRALHPGLHLVGHAGLVLGQLGHAVAGTERGRQPFGENGVIYLSSSSISPSVNPNWRNIRKT